MTGSPISDSGADDLSALPRRVGSDHAVEVHRVLDSTNRVALDRAEAGAQDGLVVVADVQTSGRGRRGRTWVSGPGESLLLSMVVRAGPDARWGWLPLAAAVAVARTVRAWAADTADRTAVKWPNDVEVGGEKIAGILVERRLGPGTDAAVVGVGLNVNQLEFPDGLRAPATSLRRVTGRRCDRAAVAAALIARMDQALEGWRSHDPGLEDAYRGLLAGVGRPATVRGLDGGGAFEGILEGVDAEGHLHLRTTAGPRIFMAGDVTLRSS